MWFFILIGIAIAIFVVVKIIQTWQKIEQESTEVAERIIQKRKEDEAQKLQEDSAAEEKRMMAIVHEKLQTDEGANEMIYFARRITGMYDAMSEACSHLDTIQWTCKISASIPNAEGAYCQNVIMELPEFPSIQPKVLIELESGLPMMKDHSEMYAYVMGGIVCANKYYPQLHLGGELDPDFQTDVSYHYEKSKDRYKIWCIIKYSAKNLANNT